ncbi:alpha/beta hydrolase [Leifsonia sp. NPDC077715]|uniref:alpha/beta hydrolase n=1 Tax=Leifsonia sp. NPDC077715 TaxID=3155539 RepID=UPI0034425A6C
MRARWVLGSLVVGVGGLALGAVAAVRATPWPSALLIRRVFTKGARETVAEMLPFVPGGVTACTGVPAGREASGLTFDVFRPSDAEGPLPTVVWVHGGAWLSGSSWDVEPYLRILAAEGFTTVGLNYTLAPEAAYPTAIRQLNDTLGHLVAHAEEYGIDPSRIVLAGDSAGAQLASQLAVLGTNPAYARAVGIAPAVRREQLAGVILNCGVYDLDALSDLTGLLGWGFKTAMWAYAGTKDWSDSPAGRTMSTLRHITADFPPTYVSGGNGDGLTASQSVPLAAALRAAGVEVTELFWPAHHEPALPHEYQFHLRFPEAREALSTTFAFLRARTGQTDSANDVA